jgi:hypothetical protein
MWGLGHRSRLVDILVILLIIGVVTNVFREWGFPWWILFFVLPVFSSWRGQQEQHEKQKREARDYDEYELGGEKQKREPRYALGDDGELIELPPEEAEYMDADITLGRRRDDYR